MVPAPNTPVKPDIFGFYDYRIFLISLFNYHKKKSPVFSHRYIVKKAGFNSPNALKNVMDGKRNLTPLTADQFANAFQLEGSEKRYFKTMVQFTQTPSLEEREALLLEMTELQSVADPDKLSETRLDILSEWWHLVIKEIIALPDYRNSAKWIANCLVPSITPDQVAESLALLKKKGFIVRTENGWEAVERILATDARVQSVLAARFHREMMKLAINSLTRFRGPEREIGGTTLRIGKKDVETLRLLLRDFRKKALNIAVHSEDPDQIYQLNFQLFPLIKTHRAHRLGEGLA